jgi:DNA-binding response OmpR family regulator
VDRIGEVHERHVPEWAKYGVATQRVDIMCEAISLLAHGEEYLFVLINEDAIPTFMSQLHLMRDVTPIPIFIMSTGYSVEKSIKAMQCGADAYVACGLSAEKNASSVMELLKAKQNGSERRHEALRVLAYGNIILSPARRTVFVGDDEVSLTKNEFDVLHCLMENRGRLVPHITLLQNIWGSEYGKGDTAVLWQTMDRLRKKLAQISPEDKRIKVERGIGYMFTLD